jgi:hypothetical protein
MTDETERPRHAAPPICCQDCLKLILSEAERHDGPHQLVVLHRCERHATMMQVIVSPSGQIKHWSADSPCTPEEADIRAAQLRKIAPILYGDNHSIN